MFYHQPSGIYLTQYRAYDPVSGRWLSRDPFGELIGGINLYAYVGGEPVNKRDLLGLLPSTPQQCPANDNKKDRCQEFRDDLQNQALAMEGREILIGFDIAEGNLAAALEIRSYNTSAQALNDLIDQYNEMCEDVTPPVAPVPILPDPIPKALE